MKIGKGADTFVTVDEVASAQMKELAAVYPVLNVDRAKAADNRFKQFVQGVFDKKLVSSFFNFPRSEEHTSELQSQR